MFLAVWTTLTALLTVGMGYSLWGDLNGGTATATVVQVYSQTAYTVSFVTDDGTRCVTRRKWEASHTQESETFQVKYSRVLPCDNVRIADTGPLWSIYLTPPVLLIAGIAAFVSTKRQEA
ncbi:hypothetical protein GCM10009687_81050 [Asanoa iriomotensis]|uniref:DUF3592 domain-containing protein n=1 Tax=Asanoa iriomotensis TaxID=234613 RepID=A0ABQ4CFG8_9ACTN|nr:hypothetical protein Air01nite_75970 [Asanoa iriomotensis]